MHQGRIVFKTKDGSLIMNRESNKLFWDGEFVKYTMECDARSKGVRVISYTVNKKDGLIYAIVDYL